MHAIVFIYFLFQNNTCNMTHHKKFWMGCFNRTKYEIFCEILLEKSKLIIKTHFYFFWKNNLINLEKRV